MPGIRNIILMFFLMAAMPVTALAWIPPSCPGLGGIDYCGCLMYSNPPPVGVAVPLVLCLADTTIDTYSVTQPGPPPTTVSKKGPKGFIPSAVYNFYLGDSTVKTTFNRIIMSLFTVAVALMGIKIFLGNFNNLKSEATIFLLKGACIIWFMNNTQEFYLDGLNIMNGLMDKISASLATLGNSGFWDNCITDSSGSPTKPTSSIQLWGMWDCVFNYLIGFSGDTLSASGVMAFATLALATSGTGFLIFFLASQFVIAILGAFLRFLQTYIMAVVALSFMFIMGFLLVPLLILKYTEDKFYKWLSLCLGYILTPVIMIGYMCMMLVALDVVLFSGANSLFEKIQPGSGANNYTEDNSINPIGKANGNTQDQFMSLTQVSLANKSNTVCNGNAVDAGMLPTSRYSENVSGSDAEANMPATSQRVGFKFRGLNLTPCDASSLIANPTKPTPIGCTAGATPGSGIADQAGMSGNDSAKYLTGIAYAFAVACLLAYIMVAVLAYLPRLVDGLVVMDSSSVKAGLGPGKGTGGDLFGADLMKSGVDKGMSAAASKIKAYEARKTIQ